MGTRYNDVWVTGSTGYLGREVAHRLAKRGYTVYGTDQDVDITDFDQVKEFVRRNRPQVVVNCAGMRRTLVTSQNKNEAIKVNGLGPRNLAIATASIDSLLVQFSSDDVFSRIMDEPVDEFDAPVPDTTYGKSKLVGENFIRELNPRHIIIRSSWLYHADGGDMGEMVVSAMEGRPLSRRVDQIACPTSVRTVCHFLMRAIQAHEYGLFHVVSSGSCTRLEFAREVYRLLGADPQLVTAAESDKATAQNIILEPLMVQMTGVTELPTWQQDLEGYLKRVGLIPEGGAR